MGTELDIGLLRRFTPLNILKRSGLNSLLRNLEVLKAMPGDTLFSKADTEARSIYLLSGTIELKAGDEVLKTIVAGTDEAQNPLAPRLPRNRTAVAVGQVEYISIDNELLDRTLTWDQTGVYKVAEFGTEEVDEDSDWMTVMLQIRAFQRIPAENIQAIFTRLQRIEYKKSDVVIRQGDEGDYFYVIVRGRCSVKRESTLSKDGIKLATLGLGDTFGEEALVSGAKRSATVTMLTDGTLMRLGESDFQALLEEPMLERLDQDEAAQAIANGGVWLDVRLPSEFKAFRKEGAVNLPLHLLRQKFSELDPSTKYVVCCDTGRRSSAAAFLLASNDYQVGVLEGGLETVAG